MTMPNIWTHILFSQDVMKQLNQEISDQKLKNYLHLGAQGPDPFFYHNFWPWQKDQRINDLALMIHQKKCGPLLLDMIKLTNDNENVRTYVTGFLTHHILDRVSHPYIHYKSGYETHNHQKLETMIDTIMVEKYRSFKTWITPVATEIDVGKKLDNELSNMMETLIQNHFGKDVDIDDGFFQKSYQDMKKVLKIVYDPKGWKTKRLSSLIPPISHRPIEDDVDYLNENRKTWYHSATNEPSNKSFIDLYDDAIEEAKKLLEVVFVYWKTKSEEDLSLVEQTLGNVSYDTGRPLDEAVENRYADPIV